MPESFYEVVWIFCIYAFFGWWVEVAYHVVETKQFINRGFLNGPYCPIYGVGVLLVVEVLTPLKDNIWILFLGSLLLTSLIEFITGFILEKVFHNKWWDYSNLPFNIKGYVCLKFSIYWGFACTMVMAFVHPAIYKFIKIIPHVLGLVLLVIFMIIFVTDLVVSVMIILRFNQHMKMLDDMAKQIHNLSDGIGENIIYKSTKKSMDAKEDFEESHKELLEKLDEKKLEIKEKQQETLIRIDEKKQETLIRIKDTKESITENTNAEIEKKQEEFARFLQKKNFGYTRLLRAFPSMKSQYPEVFARYKESLMEQRKKKKAKEKD